jgi:hypothetical protein
MKRRPPVLWVLLAAFAVGCVWWTFHVPYRPERLARAIPLQATVLTAHHDLAARWGTITHHPLVLSVAQSLGVDPRGWEALSRDATFRRILKSVASDDLALAYVPSLGASGEPAWVFSAWLGGGSQRLRWYLKSVRSPELRRAASRQGWMIWVWTPRGMKGGERITFTITEGMLVGCIAAGTSGIDELVACVDGNAGSVADRRELAIPPASPRPDRGWVRMSGWGGREAAPLTFALDLLPGGGVAGSVLSPVAPAVTGAVSGVQAVEDAAALVGDLPTAYAIVDRSLARVWLEGSLTNLLGREVLGLLRDDTAGGTVSVSLLGGPHSGRFMAVRVPTLVAGVTVADPPGVVAGMGAVFDRLNAKSRWGLVPQLVQVGTQRVWAVEGTGRGAYSRLDAGERLAYLARGRSLVVGSNLDALTKLLREQDARGAPAQSRLAQGLLRMREGTSLAYLWFDLREGGKVVRLALTAWSLKLLVEDASSSREVRERMQVTKAWLDALAPLGELQLWVRPRVDGTEFEFKIGGV